MIVCPHRPPCPGCPRLGERGIDPRALGALEELARDAGAPSPRVVRGAPTGYRHRARLAVRGRPNSPKIGIFETGTHRAVAIPSCLVHHPLINEVARALGRAIVQTRTPPYSDAAHQGLVRYVQIAVERRSLTAQVVLVANAESPEPTAAVQERLSAALGPKLHSLFWNGNPERTNTILGPEFRRLHGPVAVVETVGGADVFYPPGAFGQGNLDLADEVVRTIHGWVPNGARVLELYAGVGAIGLGLAPRAGAVTFNEIDKGSLAGLELGRAALAPEPRDRTRVIAGSAESALAAPEAASADVVIADPPRKGLDPGVREWLRQRPPPLFVYVACGLKAFLDDTRALLSGGGMHLGEIAVFDLFPHTEHVEVVARFDRAYP